MVNNLEDDRILEDNVKQAVLNTKGLLAYLGNLGKTKIIYEKAMNYGNLIADAVCFTQNQGIIGYEIKTEYDTLKRLPKQLDSYVRVCNYVFVFCHDSKVKEVSDLLNQKGYGFVGIIGYTDFNGDVISGLYQNATPSPKFSLKACLSMLWKNEIYAILSVYINHPTRVVQNTLGGPTDKVHSQYRAGQAQYGIVRRDMTKRVLVSTFVSAIPPAEGVRIICEMFITENYDPKKNLQLYNYGDSYIHDVTFPDGYKRRR